MGASGAEERRLDLRTLNLSSGQGVSLSVPIAVDDIVIAGQRYRSDPPSPEATVDVSQSASGWHVRLRLDSTLRGPCWRCLTDATVAVATDVRDFAAFGRDGRDGYDEDLDCEYLEGEMLDLEAMARDGVADVLPTTILCAEGCKGLCPTCGANLNQVDCDCPADAVDPRWADLAALAERLREPS